MKYIKNNNKWARQRGTTLIELSVVIAVILLLVGVLFIGVTAWKNGANKAACLVNISTIQKAARGFQNMNPGDPNQNAPTWTDLAGTGKFFAVTPTCPAGGSYTLGSAITDNTAYATCSNGSALGHVPANTNNW